MSDPTPQQCLNEMYAALHKLSLPGSEHDKINTCYKIVHDALESIKEE